MDVMPQAPGHALVVPKAASRNILDADPAVLAQDFAAGAEESPALKAAFAADGITRHAIQRAGGRTDVFHLHFHVIPRFEGLALKPHSGGMEDAAVLAANAEKLKAALAK